jgi:hypothetical protein
MTASEEILARKERYSRIERASDSLGRMIGVRRLKPSQQLRIQEMAPGLDGSLSVTAETKDGVQQIEIPRNSPLIIAASVCEIDSTPIPFPKNRAELDSVLDRLDNEGIEAAGRALGAMAMDDAEVDPKEIAKN